MQVSLLAGAEVDPSGCTRLHKGRLELLGVRVMNRAAVVKLTVAVVILIFVVGSWISSGKPDLVGIRYFSGAVAAVTLLLAIYDFWLWQTKLFQRLPSVPRNVRGTWKGRISSLWTDASTGLPIAPVEAFLVVRQTATSVNVRLLTEESSSSSALARVENREGIAVLQYLYTNRPRASVRDRSEIHHGAVLLELSGMPAHRVAGNYWTDRDSKGELRFDARNSKIADDFDDAEALFATAGMIDLVITTEEQRP